MAWDVYGQVKLCRLGDWNNHLDFASLFKFMDLMGFEKDTALEIFEKVYAIEAELLTRQAKRREEEKKSGRP